MKASPGTLTLFFCLLGSLHLISSNCVMGSGQPCLGEGCLGSDPIFVLESLCDFGLIPCPVGAWGKQIGNVEWGPLQLAFPRGCDGHGCFSVEPRGQTAWSGAQVKSVSPSVKWGWY